ncbi:hypothetical protein C6C12_14165 [Clostridium botulinum]|nr:hypothetical protein B2M06_14055 [Clostridium botulinum]OSA86041.1 hypothetical protein B2H91_08520 [Clostridium botulinum]PSL98387.1 hypothetical protein C6C12_14165 [Clostridium botulinum]
MFRLYYLLFIFYIKLLGINNLTINYVIFLSINLVTAILPALNKSLIFSRELDLVITKII